MTSPNTLTPIDGMGKTEINLIVLGCDASFFLRDEQCIRNDI